MATKQVNRESLCVLDAHARYVGGGYYWFCGKCTSGGKRLSWFFTSEDEAVRFYLVLPRHVIDENVEWDDEDDENVMVEDVYCDEIQPFLTEVFDRIESKRKDDALEWDATLDGFWPNDIKAIRDEYIIK